MAMSYRRAWLLVDSLNTSSRRAVVDTPSGGRHGGGAHLTPFRRELVARYRTMEREVVLTAKTHVGAIEAAPAPDEATREPAEAPLPPGS
jgi:molybdate transport system regulatory protein